MQGDVPDPYRAIIEAVTDRDRRYFEAHPGAESYYRDPIPGAGIVIEPRYVEAILDGITADGLQVGDGKQAEDAHVDCGPLCAEHGYLGEQSEHQAIEGTLSFVGRLRLKARPPSAGFYVVTDAPIALAVLHTVNVNSVEGN